MKGLTFAGKMLVIGVIFTVPIALLVIVLFLQIKGDIDFAAQERLGAAYTKALRPVFTDLETYRFTGDARLRARIDSDFLLVHAVDAGAGAALGLHAQSSALEQRWHERANIDAVIDDTLALLVAVSDNSKITLDPILDGYYVGDTMVNKVPRLIDGITRVWVSGSHMVATARPMTEDRIAITIASGQVVSNDTDIDRNIPIAIGAAPYLDPPLSEFAARQHADATSFMTSTHARFFNTTTDRTNIGAYQAQAQSALTSAFALYDASIDGLDDVLHRRISGLVYRECIIFSIVLIAIVGAALTMLVTTRSMARRLGAVTTAIRTIVAEDMTHLVELANAIARGEQRSNEIVTRPLLVDDGRDEAAVLADSYNALVARLSEVNADFVTMTTQLSTRAFHDALTGLANRALFMERITQMIARNQRRTDHFAAVLFLDLDRFKLVNDSLGHLTGDLLLIAVSRRLERCLRPGDTLSRLGGDEFTILLEDIETENDAVSFAERILNQLAKPFNISGREMVASASIGIAISRTGYESPEDMLRDADIAMYRAKQLGKNRCELFAPEFLQLASSQLQLETDLVAAIERQEFVLFYQPIVALKTNELRGFEALIRWHHPERGLVTPDDFIPAAEESGAILAIGAQVIREAGRQVRVWRDAFDLPAHFGISVNVSARQFSNPRLIDEIKGTLAMYELGPQDLHVEITESALMGDPKMAASMLHELTEMGIDVHLDDFGTGFSSLGYLHRFPVKTIKVDKSFVSMSGDGVGSPQIVATIASLAQSLSMQTTVEGIETAEQLAHLRGLNCTNGQGYYFSRPVDARAATDLIASWPPEVLREKGRPLAAARADDVATG